MSHPADLRLRERGAAFLLITILSVSTVGIIGAFLMNSLDKVRHTELEVARRSAFNAAESGLNLAISRAWALYRNDSVTNRVTTMGQIMENADNLARVEVQAMRIGRSGVEVTVANVSQPGASYADLRFVATGSNDRSSRSIEAVVRFGHRPAEIFDHAYFINNFGWLWGSGITVNGSVRSNGNFSTSNPVVNGDIYAAENPELGATGAITGSSRVKTLDWYNSHMQPAVRPSNPSAPPEDTNGNGILDPGEDVNGNGRLDDFSFEDGYGGTSDRSPGLQALDMPQIGDLTMYSDLAREQGGTLKIGGETIIDAVLGDDPGEGKNLVLIGTPSNPIVIDGPVVVLNDLVIKGTITGQGSIYTGRNVHIVGDIEYANPPNWPKPMTDTNATRAANAAADMVGFAAKGSIILGNYTQGGWQSVTRRYQQPPFTQAYKVDPTDAGIGYVTHLNGDGESMFDGDYRANDGGTKASADPGVLGTNPGQAYTQDATTGTSRKFFESSFSDTFINAVSDSQVQHIDGILYTNHLLSGKVGAAVFNGTLVSRDEALIFSGSIDINYDIRTRFGSYEFLNAFLPREPDHRILYWSERQ